jgi:hypothetical protein
MNGNSIGNGIILRPGERVFLERYLDEAKKFLFETYVVDGDNKEVKEAIANNGDVVVKFYNEDTLPGRTFYGSGNTLTINNPSWNVNHTTPFTYTTHNTLGGTSIPTHGTFTTTSTNAFYNSSLTSSTSAFTTNSLRSLETGRVEKGTNSSQTFTYDNTSFNTWPFATNWWKIKPESTKLKTRDDLAVYCTECGSKRKKDNHKFCPHCGTKF